MNALLDQFLLEARDLVERATDDLFALERQPGDRPLVDRVFRAFHTLKGSADIIGLPAMSLALHAAEDVIAAVREGSLACSADIVDHALRLLGQVSDWVDGLEASATLPPDAETVAARHAANLRAAFAAGPGDVTDAGEGSDQEAGEWVDALLATMDAGSDAVRGAGLVAIAYDPLPRAFFSGGDPLDYLRRLPGLAAIDVAPRQPWPEKGALDPFACNLKIRALAVGSRQDVAEHFRLIPDQVRIFDVRPKAATTADLITDLLMEQRLMLLASAEAEITTEAMVGRIGAAERTVINALRSLGDEASAATIEQAAAEALAAASPAPLLAALDAALAGPVTATNNGPLSEPVGERLLRVDAAKADLIADLAGELVIARNGFAHLLRQAEAGLDATELTRMLRMQYATLDRLTAAMHGAALQLRLLPLRHVFRRFPRLVREIAQDLGKEVELHLAGADVEADKSVIEKLYEPLLHVIRNALDHGCEPADERRALGKAKQASLTLRARREGGGVSVEISDDGRGIDPAVVRRAAVARGLLTREAADLLPDEEALQLVFLPGFSTASQVSRISGRGVGMDAVRSAIDALGGRITLSSSVGDGTTVGLHLPHSLVMTDVMTVTCGGEQFGIPLDAVVESTRIARSRLVPVRHGQAFVLRAATIPVVRLSECLDLQVDSPMSTKDANIVIVSTADGMVGIEVDGFGARMETMMKPLDGLLAGMPNFLGTTLTGDGRVLLVLDVDEAVR